MSDTRIYRVTDGYMIRFRGAWYVGAGEDWCLVSADGPSSRLYVPVHDNSILNPLRSLARREAAREKWDSEIGKILAEAPNA